MKKIRTVATLIAACVACFAFAQEEFSEDDIFMDIGIDDATVSSTPDASSENEPEKPFSKNKLSQGVVFDNGSIKIGGKFDLGFSTLTALYDPDSTDFGENIKNTTFSPDVGAWLYVDARPTQMLRMYTKFGVAYPFTNSATSSLDWSNVTGITTFNQLGDNTVLSSWFTLKELFSDFNIKERAFFRFGLHTVTWGAGYFFSPVSDIINTSSINPEKTDDQVNGSLNLRTQITFPGTQNCLWLYVIPSTDFVNKNTVDSYARDTAFAAKGDFTIKNWEIGLGGYFRYQNAPKAMLTATGSIFKGKVTIFSEFVYQYGSASEWLNAKDAWNDKTSLFMATAGFSKYWKTQNIMLASQYYFNSNDKEELTGLTSYGEIARWYQAYFTNGHNVALYANFGRLFGTTDLTATVFGMVNFGRMEMSDADKTVVSQMEAQGGGKFPETVATFSAMLNYSPIKELTVGLGPYIQFTAWDKEPVVNLKFSATLGGGKF